MAHRTRATARDARRTRRVPPARPSAARPGSRLQSGEEIGAVALGQVCVHQRHQHLGGLLELVLALRQGTRRAQRSWRARLATWHSPLPTHTRAHSHAERDPPWVGIPWAKSGGGGGQRRQAAAAAAAGHPEAARQRLQRVRHGGLLLGLGRLRRAAGGRLRTAAGLRQETTRACARQAPRMSRTAGRATRRPCRTFFLRGSAGSVGISRRASPVYLFT